MLSELFSPDQLAILTQIILIDLVLAGDNAIIIGMVASKFPIEQRKKVIFWMSMESVRAQPNWLAQLSLFSSATNEK